MAAADYSVLHILHNIPTTSARQVPSGGTEYHVADLIRHVPAAAHWSLFARGHLYRLTAHLGSGDRHFRLPGEQVDLCRLVERGLFDVVHLHQPRGLPIEELADALGQHGRYCVSLHDFQLCCPLTHLVTPAGRACSGHECAASCGQRQETVDRLRATAAALLGGAAAVVHFSGSTREKLAGILGDGFRWRAVEHGIEADFGRGAEGLCAALSRPGPGRPLKAAFLGGLNFIKGAELVRQITRRRTLADGTPVEWHLVGTIYGKLDGGVVQHGRYARHTLPRLLRSIGPHLVVIPSIAPETYCLTLDEAWACGIPAVVTPEGAPAERVRRLGGGWVLPELSEQSVLAKLTEIAGAWDDYLAVRRQTAALPLRDLCAVAEQYDRLYREVCGSGPRRASERGETLDGFLDYLARRQVSARRMAVAGALAKALVLLERIKLRSLVTGAAERVLPAGAWARLKRLLNLTAVF